MTDAVIVPTARTLLAKSWKGALNMTHGATLGGHAIEHAVKRAGIDFDPAKSKTCSWAAPIRRHHRAAEHRAPAAALRAGMPDSVSGVHW